MTTVQLGMLYNGKKFVDFRRQRFGHHQSDEAVEFVNLAHSFYSWRGFWDARAVTEPCGTLIARPGIDFAEPFSHWCSLDLVQ